MMSSSSSESSTPLMVGSSSLPKVPLSYRWTIEDAKTFLDERLSFSSPPILTNLQMEASGGKKDVFWQIHFVCGLRSTVWGVSLHCYDPVTPPPSHPLLMPTFLIVGCKFVIVNPHNDQILLTGKHYYPSTPLRFEVGQTMEFMSFKPSDLPNYTVNGSLTVQVNAAILCHFAPREVVCDTSSKVPLDSIRKELFSLYSEEVFTDVTVRCGDKEFKAHKVILASQSPVLRAMFDSDMKERRDNVIEIADFDPEVVKELLAYMYTGCAPPNLTGLAKQLLNAADKYQLPRLAALCVKDLKEKLKIDNVIETLLWAYLLSKELKAACFEFIRLNAREVKNTSGWEHLKENSDKHSSLLVELMELIAFMADADCAKSTMSTDSEQSVPPEDEVEVAPNPLVVGSSSLPKIPLSYRWIIKDARTFLDKRSSLGSPSFSTVLPLNKEVFWKIKIEKKPRDRYKTYKGPPCFGVFLEYDHDTTTKQQSCTEQTATILISRCRLTMLNLKNEVVFAEEQYYIIWECKIANSGVQREIVSSVEPFRYLFGNTLIIQLNATIMCHFAPSEIMHKDVRKVPLDSIRNELHCLYRDEVLADVIIKCEGKEFKAHKAILASQSPVLKTMFEVDMEEKKTNIIEISDFDLTVVSDLLEYMYTGSAPHLSTLAKELLNAADKYNLPRLLAMCANELQNKLSKEDVLEVLILADLHKTIELKSACLKFMHLHIREIKRTSGWKDFKENAERCSVSLLVEIMESLAD